MLTADIPLTEQERDVVMDQLRGFLQSIDESGQESYSALDTIPVDFFDSEYSSEVIIIQGILKKLKEAF